MKEKVWIERKITNKELSYETRVLKEKPIKSLCNSLSTLSEIIKENWKLHANMHSKYKIKTEEQYNRKSRYPVNFKNGKRNTRRASRGWVRERRKFKSNILTVCITPELPGSCTIYRVYLTHTHTGAHSHLLVEGYLLAWSELRLLWLPSCWRRFSLALMCSHKKCITKAGGDGRWQVAALACHHVPQPRPQLSKMPATRLACSLCLLE